MNWQTSCVIRGTIQTGSKDNLSLSIHFNTYFFWNKVPWSSPEREGLRLSIQIKFDLICCQISNFHSCVCRERKMKVRSERSSTTAWAKASPSNTTRTTASCCTPSTSSLWWPSSSPTWPWIRSCASSAKCTAPTSTTARRTAIRDALTWSSPSPRDLSRERALSFWKKETPDNKNVEQIKKEFRYKKKTPLVFEHSSYTGPTLNLCALH